MGLTFISLFDKVVDLKSLFQLIEWYTCFCGSFITAGFILKVVAFLFSMGLAGTVCNKRNIVKLMACFEVMLVAAALHFTFSSVLVGSVSGQMYAVIILAIGAAEAAIGLGLLISAHRNSGFIVFQKYNSLRN